MTLLSYRVRPSAGGFTALPFEPHEIDSHPDGDRIWATILRMRETFRDEGSSNHHERGTDE